MNRSYSNEIPLSNIAILNPKRELPKNTHARYVEMAQLSTINSYPVGFDFKPYTGGAKFSNGDTILARITPCLENGKCAYINFLRNGEVAFGSTEYIVIAPKEEAVTEFLYCLARYEPFRKFAIKNMNGSSGRQRVSAELIGQYSLPQIAVDDMIRFHRIVRPLFVHIQCRFFENLYLSSIRDIILPKLLSGEIDVSIFVL